MKSPIQPQPLCFHLNPVVLSQPASWLAGRQAGEARALLLAAVQVKGAPRSNALAKDSEWVRQRKALEAGKPADVNEVGCGFREQAE